ncbi:MAG: hypothetical protein KDG44_01000 [Burkholderiaceae bacterium]|nr:hypothetical protein [Burkholderiaceae bacterium]
MQTLNFEIDGVSDSAASAEMHRAIARLDGVAYVDVCGRTGSATILIDSTRATPIQIAVVIARLGCSARVRQVLRHEEAA